MDKIAETVSNIGWCSAAVAFLRALRAGKSTNNFVEGVQLVEKVTRADRATCYHLTRQTREMLKAGGALPWGA